ncbi:hypothetical protein E2C01_067203 [Portunus trituberculatus]|uniref:Uncharacterized protein n=1 Tax=Portunus trituberculatus TaxID=210409 RepID=A0A5B7HKC9_PORTR|nr:hypothetical protein [Portunus trituberculatus]
MEVNGAARTSTIVRIEEEEAQSCGGHRDTKVVGRSSRNGAPMFFEEGMAGGHEGNTGWGTAVEGVESFGGKI